MTFIDFGKGLREQVAQRDQRISALTRDIDALNSLVDSQARRLDRASRSLRTLAVRIRAQTMADITPDLRKELVDLVLDVQLALKPPIPPAEPSPVAVSEGEMSVHKG